jgi:DNA-binding CsgD family transcriptional regulator
MYKYLPISENLQEMMVMLKSLPAHTLVFDAKSNLVDLNQPALKLLKIDNLDEFNGRQNEIFPTQDYIKIIIRELKKGNTVRHAKTVLRYPDNTQVIVELCGCMVNGCRDLFLFQLFEITLSTNADLGSFISYNDNVSNPEAVIPQSVIWATNPQNAHISAQKRKPGERRSNRLAESCTIQLKSSKYRKLTKIEATIAKFAAINMSVSEIATITGKSNLSVRVIMRRVQEKQKLNAQQAAGLMINDQ